jgi:phosphohistidine phosphatase SixA
MSQSKLKLWVGVGAYLLSGVAVAAIAGQSNATETQASYLPSLTQIITFPASLPTTIAEGSEGGEGGEGGEGSEPAKPTDAPLPSPSPSPSPQDNKSSQINSTLSSKSTVLARLPVQTLGSETQSIQPILLAAEGGEGGEGGEGEAPASEAAPAFTNKLSGTALVSALQQGGYIIYFRHTQTDKDYADQADSKLDLTSCATQRTLSEMGWKQARAIGAAFQTLKIPVGQVYSSQYCRAWQTADLAFGRYQKSANLNFLPFEEFTPAQMEQMKKAVMPYLTTVPASGTNTVVVGHDDVFESATGIYPEPQGIAYIAKPNGQGGFELVASVKAEEWAKLMP